MLAENDWWEEVKLEDEDEAISNLNSEHAED